ncbi:MAG: Rpn family recombination-promoting nuclease/putative transposase [Prevotellaceae bacterium]|nr:Rpn family recombination-promoting nuclease/putative transposase [Prevotellaceae bacterium]
MNLKTDYAFKKIFGNKVLLISFLNAIGTLPEIVEDIEYLPLEQLGYDKTIRRAVYDLYVKTTSNKRYIIEMQIAEQKYFAERMILYASHAVTAEAMKGKMITVNDKGETIERNWDYDIAGVYMIAIVDFIMFPEDVAEKIMIEEIELMRRKANLPFSDKYKFTVIELPKFRKTLETLSTMKEKWLFVLRYLETFRSRPKEMNEDVFKELYNDARIKKLTNEEMEKYKQSVLEYGDYITFTDRAEEKGFEKGKKEGIEESLIKFAKNCYKHNMSLKEIARILEISEEEVYNLLDN